MGVLKLNLHLNQFFIPKKNLKTKIGDQQLGVGQQVL